MNRILTLAAMAALSLPLLQAAVPSAPDPIWVSGNQFMDGPHGPVRLKGVNIAGAEYACQEGWGIWDTPDGKAPSDAALNLLENWGANTVRLPVNETCWLGLSQVKSAYRGTKYQSEVKGFVSRLTAKGFVVVFDLHRSAPGSRKSLEQDPMPNRDHSLDFWSSAANTFKGNRRVLFGAYNEPYPHGAYNTARAWRCWRDGGCTQTSANGGTYTAAGMAEIVNTIRATGARNVILLGGLHWAENISQWLAYKPAHPSGQLAADTHIYSPNRCNYVTCYENTIAPLAAKVPVLVGEIGPDLLVDDLDGPCRAVDVGSTGFSKEALDWIDAHGLSFTAWAWNPWGDCWSLVKSWTGPETSPWGETIKARL